MEYNLSPITPHAYVIRAPDGREASLKILQFFFSSYKSQANTTTAEV